MKRFMSTIAEPNRATFWSGTYRSLRCALGSHVWDRVLVAYDPVYETCSRCGARRVTWKTGEKINDEWLVTGEWEDAPADDKPPTVKMADEIRDCLEGFAYAKVIESGTVFTSFTGPVLVSVRGGKRLRAEARRLLGLSEED